MGTRGKTGGESKPELGNPKAKKKRKRKKKPPEFVFYFPFPPFSFFLVPGISLRNAEIRKDGRLRSRLRRAKEGRGQKPRRLGHFAPCETAIDLRDRAPPEARPQLPCHGRFVVKHFA